MNRIASCFVVLLALIAPALIAPAVNAQTVTIPAAADTYLRQSSANKNQGLETVLHVQQSGHNRALVRMDPTLIAAAVATGSLASATLELYVSSAGNWSADGRTVDLHRLTAGWTELGATWSCPDDTNPLNSQANCATQWDGGTFDAEASDSVLHTNSTSGYVQFNVTEDVRSFLAGTPNYGWLAKLSDETLSGNADYVSRQGSLLHAPRLVLVVESPLFDQVPPSLAITSPTHSVLINETTPQVGLSYSDGGSGVSLSSLTVKVDGVAAACTPAAGSATCLPSPLGEGNHTVTASLRDRAGNTATASRAFTLLIGPGRRSTIFPVVGDTYLRQGDANQNLGNETTLRVRQSGKNRSLARFDAAEIRQSVGQGTLVSASLELTIAKNGKNWSKTGRTVDAHRLTADWTEAGATWNCGIDTQPANNQPNCSSQWAGGTFQSTPTASVLHTSTLAGTVSFDVTADVASLLTGTSSYGWLVKKREENLSGLVDYAAREAGAANAPRLVVVFDVPAGNQDTTPPALAITAPDEGSLFNAPRPAIELTFFDLDSGTDPASLRLQVDATDATSGCTLEDRAAHCVPGTNLTAGEHAIVAEIRDHAGNRSQVESHFTLVIDATPPVLTLASPAAADAVAGELDRLEIAYTDAGSGIDVTSVSVTLDGAPLAGCGLALSLASCPVPALAEGPHPLSATVRDLAGNLGRLDVTLTVLAERGQPVLAILSPSPGPVHGSRLPAIELAYSDALSGIDPTTLLVSVDAVNITADCAVRADGASCPARLLAPGVHTVAAEIADRKGNRARKQVDVELSLALQVAVTSPAQGALFKSDSVRLEGTASPLATTVRVGGLTAPVTGGSWVLDGVPLREGSNALTVVANSPEGGIGTATVIVIRDTEPPIVAILSPRNGFVTSASQIVVSGDLADSASSAAAQRPLTVLVNGQVPSLTRKSFVLTDLLLVPGDNRIEVTAEDAAGNIGRSEVTVRYVQDAAARIEKISGDFQEASVRGTLTDPLLVRVVDFQGRPLAGRTVDFAVTRGDGAVISFPDAARKLSAVTDEAGLATMQFALGTRAGSGNQEVTVSSLGIPGALVFCASARTKPAHQIQPIVGTDFQGARSGAAGQLFPKPLLAQVFDEYGNPVPGVEVTFRAVAGGGGFAGEPETRAVTDEEGKAVAKLTLGPDEGINNNVVEAKFAAGDEHPARFVITGMIPGPAEATSISGVLLDPQENPVPGARMHVGAIEARTDVEGKFRLPGVPVGTVHLGIDGGTVTRPGTWPDLGYELVTVSGRDNTLGKPLRLPQVDAEGRVWVGGDQDVVVPMRGVAGASLTVFAHSATFADGSHEGWMSFTQVPTFKVPMVAPMGSNFQLAWTLQPAGVLFNPPARVTLPNFNNGNGGGAPPGSVLEVFSFDHDLEEFVSAGNASVSEDGRQLVSSPGMGIAKAGWGGAPPPPPPPAKVCEGGECHVCPVGGGAPISRCTSCQVCTGGGCPEQTLEGVEIEVDEDPPSESPENPELSVAKAGAGPTRLSLNRAATLHANNVLRTPQFCQMPEYTWNFGDDTPPLTVRTEAVQHTYKKLGPFTVMLTLRCIGCDVSPVTKTAQVRVEGKFQFDSSKALISNQIPGSECNALPPLAQPVANIPMLVGATSGSHASLMVHHKISHNEAAALAFIGVRKLGEDEIIKSVKVSGATGPTELGFDAQNSTTSFNTYEVIAGFDEDGSGKLDKEEIQVVFPSGFMVITQDDYDLAFNIFQGERASYFPAGGSALELTGFFLGLSGSAGSSVSSTTLDFFNPAHSLSHPTGVPAWSSSCTAQVPFAEYSPSHPKSKSFALSPTFATKAVRSFLTGAVQSDIRTYLASHPIDVGDTAVVTAPGPGSWNYVADVSSGDWSKSDPNEFDNFLSFGKVTVNGNVRQVMVRRDTPTTVVLVGVYFNGEFFDTEDFNFKATAFGLQVTKQPATLQAGYPTLGAKGMVFRDKLSFSNVVATPVHFGIFKFSA